MDLVRKEKKPLKDKHIEEALIKSGGFVSQTAKMLGVTSQAIYLRLKKSPELQAVKEAIEEAYLDLAESKLISQVNEGNLGAICFYLKCKGKQRGYVERQEHTGADGKPIEISEIKVSFVSPKPTNGKHKPS